MPSRWRSAPNFPRSSARSIEAGEVPRTRYPSASRADARRSGVCPPVYVNGEAARLQLRVDGLRQPRPDDGYELDAEAPKLLAGQPAEGVAGCQQDRPVDHPAQGRGDACEARGLGVAEHHHGSRVGEPASADERRQGHGIRVTPPPDRPSLQTWVGSAALPDAQHPGAAGAVADGVWGVRRAAVTDLLQPSLGAAAGGVPAPTDRGGAVEGGTQGGEAGLPAHPRLGGVCTGQQHRYGRPAGDEHAQPSEPPEEPPAGCARSGPPACLLHERVDATVSH
jgi:hypothetical protein